MSSDNAVSLVRAVDASSEIAVALVEMLVTLVEILVALVLSTPVARVTSAAIASAFALDCASNLASASDNEVAAVR